MKRHLLLCLTLFLFSGLSFAQSFSDDFESYAVGDYVGESSSQWTTWSGTEGGAEDAQISSAYASSGSNSLHIISGGAAGPQDVVLPFGAKYTSGQFNFSMDLYIPGGKNGYYNFQGDVAIGTTWSMNTNLTVEGDLNIDDSSFIRLQNSFPHDEWFTLTYEVNLTANIWKVLLNDECLGTYSADINSVASLDLFPVDGDSEFYVDNVAYTYDSNASVPKLDGAIFNGVADLLSIANSEVDVVGAVLNNGTDNITSFSVDYDVAGTVGSESFQDVNIAPGAFLNFTLSDQLTVLSGDNVVTMTLTEVNGSASDEEDCNNQVSVTFRGFEAAPDRGVWVEEGTGTWCQWCPRGDVFMNALEEKYHESFVGIAVHNNDPMVVAAWDTGVGNFPGFGGYPNMIIGRTIATGFGSVADIETHVVDRIQMAPVVVMEHGAVFDENTRELQISVTARYLEDYTGNSWLIVGLTEDGVTGNNSGYNQSNAYSGGANGVMGGYETLGNPVPFNQMTYNHVGRALFTPFNGIANPFGTATITAGTEKSLTFSIQVPDSWNIENMKIVSAFRNFFGRVNNAKKSTIEQAEENGLTLSTFDVVLDSNTDVFPNPFSEVTNVRLNLEEAQDVKIEVYNSVGKMVATRNYGNIVGDQLFQFDGRNLESGMYILRLYAGEKFTSKRVVIAK